MENNIPKKRNIWNLVLGLVFLGYGCYRLYSISNDIESDTLGLVLSIGFIAFGIYDLWKYYKAV